MQHFHELVWLDRDLAHIWMCRIERCTQLVTLCTFLLRLVLWRCQNTAHFYWCLHTFVKYVECMQHFHELVWLDRNLAHIWMCRIERCTQWLHSVHSSCAWCSDVVKILPILYWCLHTFVKYVECMQHFHELVWLDRKFANICMCRIERCTQWLHSVHSCCAWCSDVVKILPISIGVCTPL